MVECRRVRREVKWYKCIFNITSIQRSTYTENFTLLQEITLLTSQYPKCDQWRHGLKKRSLPDSSNKTINAGHQEYTWNITYTT